MNARYHVVTTHGEGGTIFAVVDAYQPEAEQPAVIHSWNTATERNAEFLARDFCQRHNSQAHNVSNPPKHIGG